MNPIVSSARTASRPEMRDNLRGMRVDFEGRHERLAAQCEREFLEIELRPPREERRPEHVHSDAGCA